MLVWAGNTYACVYLLTILIELVDLSHTVCVQETMNFKHQLKTVGIAKANISTGRSTK